MNIRTELLIEHSKENTQRIAAYIGTNQDLFNELVDLFITDEYRVTQRAAWVMSHCTDNYPDLARPHFDRMLKKLQEEKLHDAIKRNTLRYFSKIDIPEELQGIAFDISFNYLCSMQENIAIKVHAMQIVFNISKTEPDLLREVQAVIEDQMDYGTTGFKSRGKKILKEIQKILKAKKK